MLSWHWQNLSSERKPGAFPWSGRAWFHFGARSFHIEWAALSNSWGLGMECDPSEDRLCFNLCVGLFSLYLVFDLPAFLKSLLPTRPNSFAPEFPVHLGREISLSFYSGGPWWCLWMDADEWHSTDPRWRRGHVDFRDVLLGRPTYERRDLSPAQVAGVEMPEATYRASFTHFEETRGRRRWPFQSVSHWWDVKIEGGIPTESDDGIWGLGVAAETLEGAAAAVRERVMESRRRDSGSRNWVPVKNWQTAVHDLAGALR